LEMFRHFDHVARRNRNILRKAAVGPKAGPAHVGADLRVADLAMAAHPVTPSWRNHHMVALRQARSFGNNAADLVNRPGDLVAWDHRRRDIGIALEETIDQKHVRPAHTAGLDLDEHFVGLDVGNRNVCEDERFLIVEDACRFHVCCPFTLLVNIKESTLTRWLATISLVPLGRLATQTRCIGRPSLITKCSDSRLGDRNVLLNSAGTCSDRTDNGSVQDDGYSAAEDDDLSRVALLNAEKRLS